jgi:hypothetical protein
MTHKPFLKLGVILGCRAGASIVLPALLGPAERWFEMGKHKRSSFKKRSPGRAGKTKPSVKRGGTR